VKDRGDLGSSLVCPAEQLERRVPTCLVAERLERHAVVRQPPEQRTFGHVQPMMRARYRAYVDAGQTDRPMIKLLFENNKQVGQQT